MKKLFLSLLAVLLIVGTAYAVNIPTSESPTAGPAVWTVSVYNNSGGTMDVGDVAIWDIEQSTGDNDNYVTTTTTADTYIVAGVVYPVDIAAGDIGTIAVHGVVQVDIAMGGQSVDGPMCTSATAGSARNCGVDAANFGFITQAVSGGSALMFVNP